MPISYAPLLAHVPAWLLVLFRITGIFAVGPVFGSTMLPMRLKALLAFGLSLCVYPMLLNDGNIVERGTHQTLLDQRGAYYDLYMSQFREEARPETLTP